MAPEVTENNEHESTRAALPTIRRNWVLGPRDLHLITRQLSPVSCTWAVPPWPARKLKPWTTVPPPLAVRHTPAVPLTSVPSQTADVPINFRSATVETTFS